MKERESSYRSLCYQHFKVINRFLGVDVLNFYITIPGLLKDTVGKNSMHKQGGTSLLALQGVDFS